MIGWSPQCYIPSFVKIGPLVLEKKILKGFYHKWGCGPSWSCDPDAANKLSFSLPKAAPHKNLALIGQVVLEEKMFENVNGRTDDGRTPDH